MRGASSVTPSRSHGTRTTAASDPGRTIVPPRTIWSYCRHTHARDPRLGEPTSPSSALPVSHGSGMAFGSTIVAIAASAPGSRRRTADARSRAVRGRS